ncbi:hypothetical protein EBR66_00730 [bacterium]|nr:hypothetical protein [bacterium]
MAIQKNPLTIGESVRVSGESLPGSSIELEVLPQESFDTDLTEVFVATTTQAPLDAPVTWSITIPSSQLAKGSYRFRARTSSSDAVRSTYTTLFVGEGVVAGESSLRVDLNRDGKMNLVDFSIMLSGWGKRGVDADVNDDGMVNLADVSILLFNWTG